MKLFCTILFFTLFLQPKYKSDSKVFMGMEVDAVCLVIYEPTHLEIPLPPPPPRPNDQQDSVSFIEKLEIVNQKRQLRSISAITSNGRFNPTIIWKSKQCLDSIHLMELDSILSKKKIDLPMPPPKSQNPSYQSPPQRPPVSPAKCYFPHHSIFVYKNNSVVYHYDICFRCRRIQKEDGEYLHGVRFSFLNDLYERLGIPTDGEELKTYIAENKRTE